jgi:hypothetical protein
VRSYLSTAQSCKSLQVTIWLKARKFPRLFKGFFSFGNMVVRILRGQPGSPAPRDFTLMIGRNAANCGLLGFGEPSPNARFDPSRHEIAHSLRRILEIFPVLADGGWRPGSIYPVWPGLQCKAPHSPPWYRYLGRRQNGNASQHRAANVVNQASIRPQCGYELRKLSHRTARPWPE